MQKAVALYLRLSQEDVDVRRNAAKDESNSISAQRKLVTRRIDDTPELAKLPRMEFCDDGFSGTNFHRPDFRRMIDLSKQGQIGCIVVKDLSRFGRDYLEVGDYLEHIFPFLGIRFISVNDQYDSANYAGKTVGMDIAFRNLVYDYYRSCCVPLRRWKKVSMCRPLMTFSIMGSILTSMITLNSLELYQGHSLDQ